MGETQPTPIGDNLDVNHRVLPFMDRFQLNEGALLEPLASQGPIDQLDPDTVSGIAHFSKELVHGMIEGYTVEGEAQVLLLRYRDIRNFARFQASRPAPDEASAPKVTKPKRQETPQKTFEEVARESLFAESDTPAIDKISSLVAKKPSNWRTLLTISRVFKEHYDLDDDSNQMLAGSVAKALREAYGRHLFSERATKQYLPEAYMGPWIAYLGESSPGFERSMHTELIKRSIDSIAPDAKVREILTIVAGFTLGMKKLLEELGGDEAQRDSMTASIMAAFQAKLRQYPEARERLKVLAEQAEELQPKPPVILKTELPAV